MKFRKSRPSIVASIGRMIVHSIPKRPDASPEKKTVTASTHSSAVDDPPSTSSLGVRVRGHRRSGAVLHRPRKRVVRDTSPPPQRGDRA